MRHVTNIVRRRRVALSVALGAAGAAGRRRRGEDADVHQGHRADLPGEVRGVPPARLDGADVAHDLRRGAAVGALDQGARRRSPDAAVADRSRRSASRNSRTIARSPTSRSRPSSSGSTPARRRATRRTCRPPKTWPDDQGWNFAAHVRPEGTGPDHQVVRLHDAGGVAGRVGQARHAVGHHRAALGARDRDPPETLQGPQDHASRDRVSRADRAGRAGAGRPAGAVHGMGGRQAGRDDAPRHRQAAAARLEVPLGHPLLAGR